jgi:penicillin amidase
MASWWKKTAESASSLGGFIGGAYSLLTRRALPPKSGKQRLDGLHATVEILTDSYGVPHIYAENEDDLYFAQGYIHAQERLWQMEFNRRIASGRLSELFGPVTLELDRFCRRLGMHRAAAEASELLLPHERQILETYARGVNAFVKTNKQRLPIEFSLLRCPFDPWRPVDTIQWGKLQAWSLSGNWESELIRARLVAKLGTERAIHLEAGYDPQHPLIIPTGVDDAAYKGVNLGLLEQYALIKELSGFSALGGSNNWAVDGTLTASGAPILCNDPHLGQAAPSIWFECHLVAGELDVSGVSFPGAPGIIIGHNQQIAWGVTNAISDVQDLYIEKFNPENPRQYEFQGQWEEAQVITERIHVRGQEKSETEEVRVTRHGPILTTVTPSISASDAENTEDADERDLPLALRWTALESFHIISAIQKLNHASNWDDFREALRDWDHPPQNFVYADRTGNIGYIMAGAIPIRKQGQALLPSPGWTGEYEWNGLIPFEELPQTYNPEQHLIVTANNRVVDDSYPYYITHEWLNGYRAQRIRNLLTSKHEKLTLDDMARIQTDQYSLPAVEIVPHILAIEADTPLKRASQEILQTWDYVLSPDSIGASIYTTILRKLTRIVLDALIGDEPELIASYLGSSIGAFPGLNGYASRSIPLVIRLLKTQDDNWFASSAIPNGPTTWKVALARAFDAALDELSDRMGGSILRWQYGKVHKITYGHPLGEVNALKGIFNRGPFPAGGDSDTVNMGNSSAEAPEKILVVPSFRLIADLGNLANSRTIHAPGQSGHPASKHYDDFIPLWRENRYHPMLFTREEIEAQSEGTFYLQPRGKEKKGQDT